MRIIVIGVSGTIDHTVSEELSQRHDIIRVGHTRGDYQVGITSQESTEALLAQTGEADAIISATDNLHFGPLSTVTDRQFNLGLQDKLLEQIRLALIGQHFLRDGGSVILISGIVAQGPIAQGVSAMTVNAGLEGSVRIAACKLPRGIRVNLVSPTALSELLVAYDDFFPGFASASTAAMTRAYCRNIEGVQTGYIYLVGYQPVPVRQGRRLHQATVAGTPTADCLRPKN